jgi:hypothetical protein
VREEGRVSVLPGGAEVIAFVLGVIVGITIGIGAIRLVGWWQAPIGDVARTLIRYLEDPSVDWVQNDFRLVCREHGMAVWTANGQSAVHLYPGDVRFNWLERRAIWRAVGVARHINMLRSGGEMPPADELRTLIS